MKNLKGKRLLIFLLLGGVFLIGLGGGFLIAGSGRNFLPQKKTVSQASENVYLAFVDEVYNQIKENYWKTLSDQELTHLFVLAIEKLTGQPQAIEKENKEELLKSIVLLVDSLDEDKKKEFVTKLADIVLANLEPFGRSRLYSKKDEVALKNTVENKNPDVDRYQILGVDKGASEEEIESSFQEKASQLEAEAKSSTAAAQKLAELRRSYEILSRKESRELYDQLGVEATVTSRLLGSNVLYLRLGKVSPTTFMELKKVVQAINHQNRDTLILDLRGNVGGSVDALPYLLGPFIGKDNFAYQFFHQGEKVNFQTRAGWLPELVPYKRVVILIDERTQSSAEIMASVLKKYNVGVLVGTKTRGWGTIEKVFPLETQIDPHEKYSMFLVHSLTLRDDGQPIEGQGVEPMVDVSRKGWEEEFRHYFYDENLLLIVKDLIGKAGS